MTLSTILIGILPSVFFGVATTLMGKTGGSDRQRVMGAVLGGLLMAAVATPFLHPAWTPLNLGVRCVMDGAWSGERLHDVHVKQEPKRRRSLRGWGRGRLAWKRWRRARRTIQRKQAPTL